MSQKPWAKGRVKGVHCVRLDSEYHEMAKKLAEKLNLSIKSTVECALIALDRMKK